ncbi:Disease resistance-like protein [Arachis hypogaea]|nr:Disease resistance-like protein [Arachis hypogaea]
MHVLVKVDISDRVSKLVALLVQQDKAIKLLNLPSLEVIDLRCSKRLKECPNLSGATNLKKIWLVGCDSLRHIHPSIFCLQKLDGLYVYHCKGLKSICSNKCSPSLRSLVAYGCPNLQEFSVPMSRDRSGINLHLRLTAVERLPPSVFHLRNLQHFSFAISDGLMDLPSNFAYQIMLSDPTKHEYNTAITLHKVLPSPIFQSVRRLIFDNCCSLTEIPENISLLSSLVHLNLYHCTNVINLPESIKYLPRLQVLSVYQCEMLQLIPILPPSLKRLRVWDCQALKTVLISESQRKDEGTFIFLNCINLDEDSYSAILRDAIVRPEVGTQSPLASKLEKQEDACIILDRDCYVNVGETCCFLPVRHNKLLDELFHEHSTEASISVELTSSSKLSGFLLYLVLSQAQLCDIEGQILYNVDDFLSFGCECYLETSCGEKLHTRSSSVIQWHWDQLYHRVNIKSDHVLLWYDEKCCEKIIETINGKRSSYSAKLAFKFFAGIANKMETVIKGCGIRWIYQNVEEESRERKSKRNREVYESVDIAFQIGQGSESHQQEPIPPTKKFKQSFLLTSASSIVEAEAAEDLRNDGTPARTVIAGLPESIKFLPQLKVLKVCHCEMLQFIPVFPPSVECLSTQVPSSSNLCGFMFYLVLSEAQSCIIDELVINFVCECYLETSWGESIHVASSVVVEWGCDMTIGYQLNVMQDHVLLWYDEECSKQIMETVKGREANTEKKSHFNAKMTVKFVARLPNKEEAMVKECGIRWIYSNLEEGSSREQRSKRIIGS